MVMNVDILLFTDSDSSWVQNITKLYTQTSFEPVEDIVFSKKDFLEW